MPTEKPRVTFTISPEKLAQVEEYRFRHKFRNQTQAILSLIDRGLPGEGGEPEEAPLCSKEARELAEAYDRRLDRWGRQAVRELVETEAQRCEDERQLTEAPWREEPKVIPLYWSAPAAGIAAPIMGEDYDLYELKAEDPQGAVFAVRVSGNSMEPYFPDGSVAFCSKDPLRDGDVGVFVIDGDSVIKQYHYDRVLGVTYLFSLNRERRDADVAIPRTSGRTLACMGRVITKRHFPVPGL